MVQDGIGEKVPLLAMNTSTFISAFIVAFSTNAKLTAVLVCIIPLIAVVMSVFRKYIVLYTRSALDAYALAGDIAEEALGAVRTVDAFSAHEKMEDRYNKLLLRAEVESIKKAVAMGIIFGTN